MRVDPLYDPLALYAANALDLAVEHGGEVGGVLAAHGLEWDDLRRAGARISPATHRDLVVHAVRVGPPAVGLLAGQRLRMADQGLFGYAVHCSPDLASAIEIYSRYGAVNGQLVPGVVVPGDEAVTYTLDTSGVEHDPLLLWFEVEQDLAMWHGVARRWGSTDPWFQRIELAYGEPPHAQSYATLFRCDVRFGCRATRISFSSKHLDRTFAGYDAELDALSEHRCESLLAQLGGHVGLSGEIRRALIRSGGVRPTMREMARRLNLSEATLRRRLCDEGTTYRELSLEVRLELAERYLVETDLPVGEIARLSGYEEVTNFSRAFRRRRGQAPSSIRGRRAGNVIRDDPS